MRICDLSDCEGKHYGQGWCQKHYRRWKATGDPLGSIPRQRKPPKPCTIPDCPQDAWARDLCGTHYRRWYRTGSAQPDVAVQSPGQFEHCTIPDCTEPHYGNGLCNKHRIRVRRHSSPYVVGQPRVNRTSFRIGHATWNKGVPMDEATKRKLSTAKRGQVPWNKGVPWPAEHVMRMRGRTRSGETRARIRAARARQIITEAHRAAIGRAHRGRTRPPEVVAKFSGPNHYGWRGGSLARNLSKKEWRDTRERVLARDGYRCTHCGSRRGLVAHHIIEFRDGGPDSVENLETLCRSCHVTHHNVERRRRRRRRLIRKHLNEQVGARHS